ncbi:di-trans,poly-cis-decaprenylcistransferase [bacterium]|nr:di-trans,poly-cis-decaprenylcistransferase [bacterium]NCQ55423.1 di-trans,poly-cis-decaprenylcistransferase [Candidatus Parcubacteria bacterium]NCS67785.1 di-trans,poly-cis-decaprenylcistransferase [Candidatus Peregrinibacteria bacterium]NCS96401.1 di-trans,poly-cis-decaprenylcistransferase [bacterium]
MSKNLAFGLIADGNRRWAKAEGLPVAQGHKTGFAVVKDVVLPTLYDHSDWSTLVVYGFSTENWKRSPKEVADLMKLYLQMAEEWPADIRAKDIKFIHAGRKDRLPAKLLKKLSDLQEETKSNKKFTLVLCLDYGSQDEISRAVEQGGSAFEKHLEVPPLDLILRTGGEQRLSNFCLWQAAYAELNFHDKKLPALTHSDMETILSEFTQRQRRKGK